MFSKTYHSLQELGKFTAFSSRVATTLFTTSPMLGEIARQINRVSIGSLFVVLLVCAFIGANMVVQGYQMLVVMGAQDLTGMFVGMAVVRELGPVLAGAMVGAKAGCEIAAEIAAMRIGQQIDALEVMAVDPYKYLIVPRVIGTLIGLPLLLAFALIGAIGSSYLVAVYQYNLNPTSFLQQLSILISLNDMLVAMLKCVVFGLATGLIECYIGFNAKPGPTGVGEATNSAIVVGAIVIAWLNLCITGIVY